MLLTFNMYYLLTFIEEKIFNNICLKVSCEADSIELGDIPDNGDLDREVDSCQVAPLAQNPLFEV